MVFVVYYDIFFDQGLTEKMFRKKTFQVKVQRGLKSNSTREKNRKLNTFRGQKYISSKRQKHFKDDL